ncbi:ABC-2 family transporter protein [Phaeobacter gallaeciensis]|uniref:ABC-2 family transporter protein n=1 Tax=Phaeobacter gallaeciensis TaxID=60890 RepID=A0AAC9ZAD5_9RHOB|nr:ABC-2 family transporter protein [Phaeobacter gallaeciensis]AHD09509.1 ABC-2 family transporter protein [Phaeobacter gallaeciensis DSM 26640]ATE92774.1 ABC-2 family transporter protein [Phaeobacter gallaeciensis]ATE97404.1 ABC-2 family transporter protein [Phaeobacter gallaeciensis]ATF01439.1 ABC-2 family transporter protein [Phaeobacter gallaeciensis]ATF05819.1 ABC-2 family transporter protein [Phaeobacter gallaeciensis]
MPDIVRNIALLLVCVCLSLGSAHFAYNAPQTILKVAPTTITALSVIFGLSLSTLAIVAAFSPISNSAAYKKGDKYEIARNTAKDDRRTILRQKYLILLIMSAVISGVFFMVIFDFQSCSQSTKIASYVFTFLSTLSLLLACFLPFVVAAQLERDAELRLEG